MPVTITPLPPVASVIGFPHLPVANDDGVVLQSSQTGFGGADGPATLRYTVIRPDGTSFSESYSGSDAPTLGANGTIAYLSLNGDVISPYDGYRLTVVHPNGLGLTARLGTATGTTKPVVGADGTVVVTVVQGDRFDPSAHSTTYVVRPGERVTPYAAPGGANTLDVPTVAKDGTITTIGYTHPKDGSVESTVTVIRPDGTVSRSLVAGYVERKQGSDGTAVQTLSRYDSAVDSSTVDITVTRPDGTRLASRGIGGELTLQVGSDGTVATSVGDFDGQQTVTVFHADGTITTVSADYRTLNLTVGPDGTVTRTGFGYDLADDTISQSVTVIDAQGNTMTRRLGTRAAFDNPYSDVTLGTDGTVVATFSVSSAYGGRDQATVTVLRPDGTESTVLLPGRGLGQVVGGDGTAFVSSAISPGADGSDGAVLVTRIGPDGTTTATSFVGDHAFSGPRLATTGSVYQTDVMTGHGRGPGPTSVNVLRPDGTQDRVALPGTPTGGVVFGADGTVYQTTTDGLFVVDAPTVAGASIAV